MRSLLSEAEWRALAGLEPAWAPLEPPRADALAAELAAEIGPGHPLFGVPLVAVAEDSLDNVLIATPTQSRPWARVHLTWRRSAEPLPWPTTEPHASIGDFLKQEANRR